VRGEVPPAAGSANGPCRFGQYLHLIRTKFDEMGYGDIPVISITSSDGYSSIGNYSQDLVRTAWRAVLTQDILMKLLLKTRPYEREKGSTDAIYRQSLEEVGEAVSLTQVSHKERLAAIVPAMVRARDRFRAVPADYDASRPLVGVVGEIFCRQNTFSNFDLIRVVEEQGGECWLSDIGEWVWYTDDEQRRRLTEEGKRFGKDNTIRFIKSKVMRADEHRLYGPFADDFVGYEEPHDVRDVLEMSKPYLPYTGALGEMVLSSGKSVYMYDKGADGIIDISPFTCMNGIVTEAVYPSLQKDLDNMPIRVFYFDGTKSGELISRVMTDAEGIRNLVGTGLVQLVGGLVTATLALVVRFHERSHAVASRDVEELPGAGCQVKVKGPSPSRSVSTQPFPCSQRSWIASLSLAATVTRTASPTIAPSGGDTIVTAGGATSRQVPKSHTKPTPHPQNPPQPSGAAGPQVNGAQDGRQGASAW